MVRYKHIIRIIDLMVVYFLIFNYFFLIIFNIFFMFFNARNLGIQCLAYKNKLYSRLFEK